jgi:protein O-GlcNAc transferase
MHKPAPVQANFLGYPGTVGATAIPYIVSDRVTIPPCAKASASEHLVMLPHTLMPTKHWDIPEASPKVTGLEAKFVLGSFHKAAKISPNIFRVWKNLAHRIPEGVLWLTRIAPNLQPQLKAEAHAAGVLNVIIHDQIPTDEMMAGGHLSVRRMSDIAVDTPGYNGHTTVCPIKLYRCELIEHCYVAGG